MPVSSADILVYINDVCVLGSSHKEAVAMLKTIPTGHSVDVVVRRGYPMLYDPDGCPKQPLPALPDPPPVPSIPTTTQPQPQPQPHLHLNGVLPHHERTYTTIHARRMARLSLDANGNSASPVSSSSSPPRGPLSYASYSNVGPGIRPRSSRGFHPHLQYDNLASQSDSEVVSAIGSHRWVNQSDQSDQIAAFANTLLSTRYK